MSSGAAAASDERSPRRAERVVVGAFDPDVVPVSSHHACERPLQDQLLDPLGIYGRELACDGAAVREAVDRRPFPADGVHDDAEVLHSLLGRRRVLNTVGCTGPASVELDDSYARSAACILTEATIFKKGASANNVQALSQSAGSVRRCYVRGSV
jgi:hypothetical protein